MDQGSTPIHNIGPEAAATAAGTNVAVPPPITSGVRKKSAGARFRDYAGSILFIVPYLAFFFAFLFYPLANSFWISLRKWTTIGGDQGWDGLKHYQNLFNFNIDSTVIYWNAMKNTVGFALVSVPLLVFVALVMALLLANGPWRAFFRSVFYIPAVLSVAVAMTMWKWIFQNGGMADRYLHSDISWLIEQPWAWMAIVIATLWWTPGFNMIVLLAGILEVPNDYHEAAKIDGANGLQRIWYITLPILRPVLAFVTITQMIASFGLFGQNFLLTQGGPAQSTYSVALAMYSEAFGADNNLGFACAESFALGIILIVLALLQIRFFQATET